MSQSSKNLNIFNEPEEAVQWLECGKILLHPTEGIWGIGCDAFNLNAVQKINHLKQRESLKSFIILAPTISHALQYFKPLINSQIDFINDVWPGHTTVIYESNDLLPTHLKSLNNTIAMRVSNHKPIKNLLSKFNSLMVSTSANISNVPTSTNLDEVLAIFQDHDVALYNFDNGSAIKPSSIINLKTMDYIRE